MGRRRPAVRAAILLGAVIALAIVGAWLLGQGGASPDGSSGSSGSSPAGSVAGPTPSPQPPSTRTLPPTAGPTTSPTVSTSSPPTTHVVTYRETLSSIANRYGVTVKALQEANGITDPNYIVVGQRLIIPAP